MTDVILGFFESFNLTKEALVFLISMVPVVELRGAIPVGVALNIDSVLLYFLTVIGNCVPVPFIILLARPVINWLLKTRFLKGLGNRLENKVRKHSDKVLKYEVFGLLIFVAIPLPGTGAWTGALIAALLDIRLKKSFPSILAGVAIAGVIMLFGSNIVKFLAGLF